MNFGAAHPRPRIPFSFSVLLVTPALPLLFTTRRCPRRLQIGLSLTRWRRRRGGQTITAGVCMHVTRVCVRAGGSTCLGADM